MRQDITHVRLIPNGVVRNVSAENVIFTGDEALTAFFPNGIPDLEIAGHFIRTDTIKDIDA